MRCVSASWDKYQRRTESCKGEKPGGQGADAWNKTTVPGLGVATGVRRLPCTPKSKGVLKYSVIKMSDILMISM